MSVNDLPSALQLLARIHTSEDQETGFVVVDPYYKECSIVDYANAWAEVRKACGLPTEPEQYK